VISTTQYKQEVYTPTVWAVLLHQVPHVNITFHRLEDERFRPDSELYLESLGIIGSVPAAWLILTLIVLLIYLLTRCCDTKNNKKRKSRPIRCCLSFFSLVCCSALGAGFYGNHVFHAGTEKFAQSVVHMDRLIDEAQQNVKSFNDVLQRNVKQNLNNLYDGIFQKTFQQNVHDVHDVHDELMENVDTILKNVDDGLIAMDKIRLKIYDPKTPISIGSIHKNVLNAESLRWWVTMGLLGLFSLFCLLLFIGAIVHSRAILILFSVCGLFSIIILWLLASIYVTLSVALADFCYNPTPWVQLALNNSFNVTDDITNFYLHCNQHNKIDPFKTALEESNHAILNIDNSVNKVSSIARHEYRSQPSNNPLQLDPSLTNLVNASAKTLTLMNDIATSLKCRPMFRFYNDALVAACNHSLLGMFVMLVSAAVCALLFTVLVWCNSHTWIYFKHKGKYVKVEDQDPYMPLSTIDRGGRGGLPSGGGPQPIYQRSRTVHTPPQTPPYHGTLNGHNGTKIGTMDQKPLPGPPTLHAGVGYGHIGSLTRGPPGAPTGFLNPAGATLGRPVRPGHMGHMAQGNGAPATMTLGRRGHYASLRQARSAADNDLPLLGPNQGQYATLSRGCKTLQNDDFY